MANIDQFETIPFHGETEGEGEWTPELDEESEIRRGPPRSPTRMGAAPRQARRPGVLPKPRLAPRAPAPRMRVPPSPGGPTRIKPPASRPPLIRPLWRPYPGPVSTWIERVAPSGGEGPSELARWTQSCLNRALGLSLPITGLLDPATREAVRRFQAREKLPVDGIVGPPTQAALGAACARGPGAEPAEGGGGGGGAEPPAESGANEPPSDAPPEQGELTRGGCGCAACRERANAGEFAFVAEGETFEAMSLGAAFESELFEGEAFEGELFEGEAWQGEASRTAPSPSGASRPCAMIPVDCPPPGRPALVLDGFRFDASALDPARHGPPIKGLAGRILASQRSGRPIRSVTIAGHTDAVGNDDYNFALARRRAHAVAQALCAALEAARRGATRGFTVRLTSCGERQTKRTPELSRRVEIFLPSPGVVPGRRNPPDTAICGVPRGGVRRELAAEEEWSGEVQTPARRPGVARAVAPALCFFQNTDLTSHRNHFHHQAARWAGRIGAQAAPTRPNCVKKVGATAYDTGADIIGTIQAARACQRKRVAAIHIFSHSGSNGVFGSRSGAAVGLYRDGVDAAARAQGARVVTDIPTDALAENVVVVLHGCNAAAGSDSVAAALFRHLAAHLRTPRVFGHPNSGCAGRDNSWREFSRAAPGGRAVRSIAPVYEGKGGCS